MSLICGIVSPNKPSFASVENLQAMLDVTSHRSRFGSVSFSDEAAGVALGHGHSAPFGLRQREASWYEDGEVVAAVAGGIHTDSWSVPANPSAAAGASHREQPADFPAGLDGFFSLFLWQKASQTLHLASDALARHLTYYYYDEGRNLLIFSSELKAVLAHPEVPRVLDRTLLPLHLRAGLIPAPLTLARDVKKLLAAESLRMTHSGLSARRYRRSVFETGPDRFDYWVKRVTEELPAAVARTVGSAQRVSVNFSGGIDSSLVLAGLKESGAAQARLLTLTYGSPENSQDVLWARRIASSADVEHEVIAVDTETDLTPELSSTLFRQMDEPHDSANRMVSEYFLCQAALRAGINSTLTGAAPNPSVRRMHATIEADPDFYTRDLDAALTFGFPAPEVLSTERVKRAIDWQGDGSEWRHLALVNRDLLPSDDLVKGLFTDRRLRASTSRIMLFSHSTPPLLGVEERSPFLDTRFAQMILSMPPDFFGLSAPGMNRAPYKVVLRRLLEFDPDERPKKGFPGPPQPAWLRRMILPSLQTLVDEGIMRDIYLRRLETRIELGRKRARREAWQWFIFNCWYQFQIKERDPFAGA